MRYVDDEWMELTQYTSQGNEFNFFLNSYELPTFFYTAIRRE